MKVEKHSANALLKKFMKEFLPQSEYRGKYSHNEFTYLHATLRKIFWRKRKIKISAEALVVCLNEAGYHFYVTDTTFGRAGNVFRTFTENEMQQDWLTGYGEDFFLFVNVSSGTVFDLRKASNSMALQKDPAEIARLLRLKKKISGFFNA